MARKRFKIFMITFIIVSVSVLTGFLIKNLEERETESNNIASQVISEGSFNDNNLKQEDDTVSLSYYVNENAVKKTKTTSNEITKFVIEAKLFITNNSTKIAHIDPDAFSINYDTDGTGLLYKIDYGNIEKPVILEGGSTTSITFTVEYVIKDVEKFNDTKKKSLKFNYIDEQILVCLV